MFPEIKTKNGFTPLHPKNLWHHASNELHMEVFLPAKTRHTRQGVTGFTIVELMIALALTGIILAAVYGVYTAFYKTSGSQDLMIEAQQNAKAGIAVIERDLINAGLNAGTTNVFTDASSYAMTFIYRDPRETIAADAHKKIFYILRNAANDQQVAATTCNAASCYLARKAEKCASGSADCSSIDTSQAYYFYEVVPNVYNIAFTYYDANGTAITPSDQPSRNNIRFVKVSLTTKTSSKLPTSGAQSTVTLTTQVHLRNMGAAGAAGDTTAPDAPTILAVRDPHVCGKLDIKWQKSTATDVAGYKIFYGTSTGQYTGSVSVSGCPGESGGTCTYTLNPTNADGTYKLQHSESDGSPTITYFIAMQSYDNSGNSSPFSTERSGNTADGNPTLANDVYDTTINPVKPTRPATFTGADGPSDNQVSLTWPASTSTDVTGYRIYRDTSAFSTYPIDASKWIASSNAADGKSLITGTSFTDTDSTLIGCQTYYYAVAAVNCDTTLVTDDAGDDNNKRYISTDYTNATGDTAPPDTAFRNNDGTSPTTPTLSVRAGWKRVAVTLTNPTRTTSTGNVNYVRDFEKTCLYVNQGITYPVLGAAKDVNGCFIPTSGQLTPDGTPDGIFTDSGSVSTFWHDSMTEESPASPNLANQQYYSYTAVSFDKCGNNSAATAQDQTNLCGEDPAGKPEWAAGASAISGGCDAAAVTLTWTPVSSSTGSPSTATNPWDLAGYRIFRSSSADFSTATLLNPAAPLWCTGTCTYTDTSSSNGGTYYYRIVATDCPYENQTPAPTEATIRNDMLTGLLKNLAVNASDAIPDTTPDPVQPGKILRDEKTAATKDSHMEILTGAASTSTTAYDYYHNTVTIYFENTSAGTMTITGLNALEWNNTDACLKKVTIGGPVSIPSSSPIDVWNSGPSCASPTGTITFTMPYENVPAGARHVPITFEFTKSDSTVDNSVDMRIKNVRVDMKVKNNSTGTATCNTYLTYSGSNESFFVPNGPEATNVTQDKPSSATSPYTATASNNPAPTSNPSVITVAGGNHVNVTITVNSTTIDHTGNPIAIDSAAVGAESPNVILYYTTTLQTVYQAPQYNGSNYTDIRMFKTAANTYSLHRTGTYTCGVTPTATHADDRRIPAQASAQRIWYFIVVKDTEGNFDRAPEVANNSTYYTAYTYDQGAFNVCSVTPAAPTNLTGAASGATNTVVLSWTAPTQYTDSSCLNTGVDPITYVPYRRDGFSGSFVPVASGGCSAASVGNSTSCTDNQAGLNVNGVDYSYYVVSRNSCATPNVSSASNKYTECVGSSGIVLSVDKTSMLSGGSFTITVNNCSSAGNLISDVINNVSTASSLDTDIFSMTENAGDIGSFTQTITTTTTMPASDSLTELYTASSDTITVSLTGATGSPQTITVNTNPCSNTPNAPTGLNLFIDGVNDASRGNSTNIHVRFTAPQANTDASNLSDLANYKLNVTKDGAAFAAVNIPLSSCTSSLADPPAGTTCDYLYDAGGKMREFVWSFTVKAVDNCSTGGNESAAAGPLGETCTAATCGASY